MPPSWADLQSLHGLHCCGNITRMQNVSEYTLVLAVCLVTLFMEYKNLILYYRMQWNAEGSVVGAVRLWCFVCVWNISGTAEWICAKFSHKMCLVPHSDEFEGQGHQGQKRHFSDPSAAFVWFLFRKTSLAVLVFDMWWVMRCWHSYLSRARCKWFAYGPADATATPSSLASLKSKLV